MVAEVSFMVSSSELEAPLLESSLDKSDSDSLDWSLESLESEALAPDSDSELESSD